MNNSKKVLLIYPGKHGSMFPQLPLPFLYLSHALREVGFKPQVLDMRLDDYTSIRPQEYLFIGISALTGPQIKFGLEVAKFIKKQHPEIPIVWGGIHPSLLPEQTLESKYVDIVAIGEGEATIKELAGALRGGTDLSSIKGIAYRIDGKPHQNPPREFIDLNKIPKELPYELFQMKKYALDFFPLHTSRGCPYRCGFCYNLVFNKRHWRAKSACVVLDEIEYVVRKFGAKAISLCWDDEFFVNTKRVKDVCEGILKRNIKIKWNASCRFNHFYKLDWEFVRLLEKSGCVGLSFGAESGSQRILDEVIKKDITIEQMVKTTERLAKTKIEEVAVFMSALPGETEQDMNKTYELIDKLCQINPSLQPGGILIYTPYPGTPLFDLVRKKYNYQIPDSLEAWGNFGVYRNVGITWQPKSCINKCKAVSILTRFPFYKRNFRWKDIKTISAAERFRQFPYNIIYCIFTSLARWRWRKRYFGFPIECWILEKVMNKIRGFV